MFTSLYYAYEESDDVVGGFTYHHSLFLFYSQEMTMKLWQKVNLLFHAQHAKTIVQTIMLIVAKFHLRRWLNFLKIVALI